jgi:hypothetical protein
VTNELEARLVALGPELELPPEPDLAPAVRSRLGARRPFPWRAAAIAFAVLVLAVGAAFAVPQARSALLRFFHLGGATVERVDTLPNAVERRQAGGLGVPLTRAEAERRVGFRLALPPFHGGQPARVYVLHDSLATVVLHAHGKTALLSEFLSSGEGELKKLTSDVTSIEPASVNGEPGFWLEGGPHVLSYIDPQTGYRSVPVRIRGNVLLWTRGERTLRLEGKLTKVQALRIARATR